MNTKNTQSKILVVDDDPALSELFHTCLEEFGYFVKSINDPESAIQEISRSVFDLIFLDIHMKPLDGFTVLNEIQKNSPETSVIIISGFEDFENALKAVEMGAYHILQKPIDLKELLFFTRKAIEYQQIKLELLAETVADSNISVLIRGESGTGKELMAEFIHEKSSRSDKPFIKVNCAAIPEGLLESELFGHIKGAFTGASRDRKGRFELAHGGTLFLDEIGEMPIAFQAKLLRVLQSGEFESVGDTKTKKVDVRILSATNINIEAAIEEKTFREDLFYRLNGATIKIPPLRDRPEDIEPLVLHFLQKFSKNKNFKISADSFALLESYQWRGNVRELENTIHRAVLLAKENYLIQTFHFPEEMKNANKTSKYNLLSLEETARILKIDLATLWRKRKRYSI